MIGYTGKVKVIHLIATLDLGGAEKQLLTLCIEQRLMGYSVLVAPFKGENALVKLFDSNGIEIYDSLRKESTWRQAQFLRKFLGKKQDIVVHAHSPKAQVLMSLVKRKANILVVSRHDAMRYLSRVPKLVSNIIWKFVSARANKIILISKAVENKMRERGEVIDERKIDICYYGLSSSDLAKVKLTERDVIRKQYRIENKFVIGSVGRFIKEKNHSFLINVFSQIVKTDSRAHLFLVGYGELEQEIREQISILGIKENVTIIGKEVSPLLIYKGMDVFVLASNTEGFGLVILEAMAASLPVVASKVDALPEVLGSSCGFLFQPNNEEELRKILINLKDEGTRAVQRTKSEDRLKVFSSNEMARKIGLIYDEAKNTAN